MNERLAIYDPLVQANTAVTRHSIDPFRELEQFGLPLGDGELFASEPRQTSHFCVKVVTNEDAPVGDITRLEIYLDRENPGRWLIVTYRAVLDDDGEKIIENQFFSNDPNYAARKKWMMQRACDEVRAQILRTL